MDSRLCGDDKQPHLPLKYCSSGYEEFFVLAATERYRHTHQEPVISHERLFVQQLDHFLERGTSWSVIRQLCELQLDGGVTEVTRIASRCNWPAEIKRAKELRDWHPQLTVAELTQRFGGYFYRNVETLRREFCLEERLGQHSFPINGIDEYMAMMWRGVEHARGQGESVYEWNKTYVQSLQSILSSIQEDVTREQMNKWYLLVSPPSDLSDEEREFYGLGTHSFLHYFFVDREGTELVVRDFHLRSELDKVHLRDMQLRTGHSLDKRRRVPASNRPDAMEILRDVRVVDGLKGMSLKEDAVMQHYEKSRRWWWQWQQRDAVRRERRYLQRVLRKEYVAEISQKLDSLQQRYVQLVLSGAPQDVLEIFTDYIQQETNKLYKEYRRKQDSESGRHTSDEDLELEIRAVNSLGNNACPVQMGENIRVSADGRKVFIDGKEKDNPWIVCPVPGCGKGFFLYRPNGKAHDRCPNLSCQYDPCTKVSKLHQRMAA